MDVQHDLVNVGYSESGGGFDSGYFTIGLDIGGQGIVHYGNQVNAANGAPGGGGVTVIVIVPLASVGHLILDLNGQFLPNEISITIVKVDNQAS